MGSATGEQGIAELMREHADLAAMMGFVRDHVQDHGGTRGPGTRPAVAQELFDLWIGAEGFRKHLGAALGALGEGGPGLALRAASAIEFSGKPEMRSRKAQPFATDVVDMGKDGGDGAGTAGGRLGAPDAGIQVTEQELVDGLADGEVFDQDIAHLGIG